MSPIKYIDYDCTDVDNVIFDKKIEALSTSYYRIDKRSLMVNYQGSAKDLYNNLEELVKGMHILIIDIAYPDFYGFHNSALWDWLNEQFEICNTSGNNNGQSNENH